MPERNPGSDDLAAMSVSPVPWMVSSVDVIERTLGSSISTLSWQLASEQIDARLKDQILELAISERGYSRKHPIQAHIASERL